MRLVPFFSSLSGVSARLSSARSSSTSPSPSSSFLFRLLPAAGVEGAVVVRGGEDEGAVVDVASPFSFISTSLVASFFSGTGAGVGADIVGCGYRLPVANHLRSDETRQFGQLQAMAMMAR